MYADRVTRSMKAAMDETERRRNKQIAYNEEHSITPATIKKNIVDMRSLAGFRTEMGGHQEPLADGAMAPEEVPKRIAELKEAMFAAAQDLDFERAAELRDQVRRLQEGALGIGAAPAASSPSRKGSPGRRRARGQRP